MRTLSTLGMIILLALAIARHVATTATLAMPTATVWTATSR